MLAAGLFFNEMRSTKFPVSAIIDKDKIGAYDE
jgi:hypothetical protein